MCEYCERASIELQYVPTRNYLLSSTTKEESAGIGGGTVRLILALVREVLRWPPGDWGLQLYLRIYNIYDIPPTTTASSSCQLHLFTKPYSLWSMLSAKSSTTARRLSPYFCNRDKQIHLITTVHNVQPLLYIRATTDSVALSDTSLLLIQRTSLAQQTCALHITMFLRGGHRTHTLHTDVAQGLQV